MDALIVSDGVVVRLVVRVGVRGTGQMKLLSASTPVEENWMKAGGSLLISELIQDW